MTTARQEAWMRESDAAVRRGDDLVAGFFALVALPNESEREHVCVGHSRGFRRNGRRGFKCGICGSLVRWVDPEPAA
jgi:hypothetical protein